MPERHERRLPGDRFLCVAPFLIAAVGALRALPLSSGIRYAAAVVLLAAIVLAAWSAGGRELRSEDPERRRMALAGFLLVGVLAVLAVIAAMGPPHLATPAENQVRYPLLLLDALAVTAGTILLAQALNDAGERSYSSLGLAAIVLAGPAYLFFLTTQLLVSRAQERAGALPLPPEIVALDEASLILFFLGVLLTYSATAALAAALGCAGWLGRRATRVYAAASGAAFLATAVRAGEALGSASGVLWGFEAWYAAPGFFLMIPAVPWLLPCLLGIVLLRRASGEARG